jgi:hypothetical protein
MTPCSDKWEKFAHIAPSAAAGTGSAAGSIVPKESSLRQLKNCQSYLTLFELTLGDEQEAVSVSIKSPNGNGLFCWHFVQ